MPFCTEVETVLLGPVLLLSLGMFGFVFIPPAPGCKGLQENLGFCFKHF